MPLTLIFGGMKYYITVETTHTKDGSNAIYEVTVWENLGKLNPLCLGLALYNRGDDCDVFWSMSDFFFFLRKGPCATWIR